MNVYTEEQKRVLRNFTVFSDYPIKKLFPEAFEEEKPCCICGNPTSESSCVFAGVKLEKITFNCHNEVCSERLDAILKKFRGKSE